MNILPQRSSIVRQFRKGEVQVLLATDVAARGLDVKDIRVVINYDAPKNIEVLSHYILH